jgi:hypothetical protein
VDIEEYLLRRCQPTRGRTTGRDPDKITAKRANDFAALLRPNTICRANPLQRVDQPGRSMGCGIGETVGDN